VFVVSQVDGEGYVLPDKFQEVAKEIYKEESLKSIVQNVTINCCTNANERAKGKCKAEQI
jgi:hypothetical protein